MNSSLIAHGPREPLLGEPQRLAGVATVFLDGRGHIAAWDSAAREMFGHAADGAVGRHAADVLVTTQRADLLRVVLGHVAAGNLWSGVIAVRSGGDPLDDDGRDAEFRCEPIEDGPLAGGMLLTIALAPDAPVEDAALDGGHGMVLLNDASARIGSTLDLSTTARELMDVAVPRFADAAGILVLETFVSDEVFPNTPTDGSARVVRLATSAAGPNKAQWLASYPVGEVGVYPAWTPFARCMASGKPVRFDRLNEKIATGISEVWGRELIAQVMRHVSFLAVPLKARGTVLGFVVFCREPGRRPFTDAAVALAEELAARAAVCIDNARLYSSQRGTALTLQSSLLPQHLASPLGMEIAHRYNPASDMTGVGGDWYDVIQLPGSRVALVIGDVMGHGTRAAATMGQLRTVVRTLASFDLTPDAVLQRLDDMIRELDPTQIATCLYATFDPVTRACVIARAGHVPPVLLRPDGQCEVLDLPPGLPLGIGSETFVATELTIEPGSTLALCTDGLVESRDHDIEHGIDRLCDHLARRDLTLPQLCDSIVDALVPEQPRDDTALMLARVNVLTDDEHASWILDAEPQAARRARTRVRETLHRWRLHAHADLTELLASELVTNAYRHAGGPIELRLLRGSGLLCEVFDPLPVRPQLLPGGVTDEAGRGLELVNTLATRWGTRFTPAGKIVWFELNLGE